MSKLKEKYQKEIAITLTKKLGLKGISAAPKLTKVVVSMGLGEGAQDKSVIESASPELAVITGQKAKVTRAKKAEAGFKLRAGDPIGLMVTLRGKRMYDFLEKLFRIVLPRVRDFQGVPLKNFDGRGNYNLGLTEQTVFPEIDYGKVTKTRGLQVTLVTNSNNDTEAKMLLELLGMPFEKREKTRKKRS